MYNASFFRNGLRKKHDGIEKSRDCLRELAGSGEWITGGRLDKNISNAELRKWMDELE